MVTLAANVPEYVDAGTNALKYFHNASLQYPSYPFKTFQSFVDYANRISPSFLNFYGKAIVTTKFSQERLREINEAFANEAEGKVPVDSVAFQSFFQMMQDDLTSISSYMRMGWEAIVESAEQIKDVAVTTFKGYILLKISAAVIAVAAVAKLILDRRNKK
jgi:hypothetical protein